jgi:hypothetical protein
MKVNSFMLAVFAMVVVLVSLAGCRNPIEEYQPYSTFDERMAEAGEEDGYAYDNQYSQYNSYFNESASGGGGYQSGGGYQNSNRPKPKKRSYSVNDSSSVEVPFSETRSPKQAANIGAL